MGNCMEKGGERSEKGEEEKRGDLEKEVVEDNNDNNNNKGIRVKMVLTKEELQWLMMQLSNRESGGKRIEDVLEEIEKGRKKVAHVHTHGRHAWKPSLDSITEIPEVLEMNRQ